ncbi:MAG: o-succinylbenzoate synthase [Pyramidobacter sp.]|jgi:O-succinylbenzoate synthase
MKIVKAVLRRLQLKMNGAGFRTSFGLITQKDFSLLELYDDNGLMGCGECSAMYYPWYNEETTAGAISVLQTVLIPSLFDAGDIKDPESFFDATSWIRRNRCARSAVDCALWDLYSKAQGVPEYKALGGVRNQVEAGVSLGVEKSPDDLCRTVEKYMKQGYRRVKCKIKPGQDIQYLRAVRERFGDIMLMADANSAYSLSDISLFKEMDDLNLLMVEQPLASDDIVDHRHLQAAIKTPICLDESIDSIDDARRAIELGSCRIINIKVARVGGLTEARRIQKYAGEHGVYCWCGGMLDAGVARGHNLAVATLPYYRYPNDIPGSDRYYAVDIVSPSTYVNEQAMVQVPDRPGMGFELKRDVIDSLTVDKWEYKK